MNKIFFSIAVVFGYALSAVAQVPTPGSKPKGTTLIKGGTIHIGNGQVITSGDVLLDATGKIAGVYPSGTGSPAAGTIVDAKGKHVYPGFIALSTTLGLQEAEAIRATRDFTEVGGLNPHVRALIAYNCESEIIPTVRYNGILTAQIEPQGGLVTGKSSVMNMDCWNWEDGVIKADEGLHINWPFSIRAARGNEDVEAGKQVAERAKRIESIKSLLAEARAYQLSKPDVVNQRLAAMAGLYDSSLTAYIHVNSRGQILEAVPMFYESGIKRLVLVGNSQAFYDVKEFLKGKQIPLVINRVHRLPNTIDEDIDMPYKLPGLLAKEGLTIALGYGGQSWQVRNLPFQAGTASAHGLGPEAALQAITLNAAAVLGLDKQLGSIEVGKDATLFISEGDALDMRTNRQTHAWINGRVMSLESKQTRLFEKYKAKLQGR